MITVMVLMIIEMVAHLRAKQARFKRDAFSSNPKGQYGDIWFWNKNLQIPKYMYA